MISSLCTCPDKIYKYVSFVGLQKTLSNRTIRLSRPSDFNDPIDMYLQDTHGMDIEPFLEGLNDHFVDFIQGNIDHNSLRDDEHKQMIIMMNEAFKTMPDCKRQDILNELRSPDIQSMYDLPSLKKNKNEFISHLNRHLDRNGVFCSTTDHHNLLMWAHYADSHKGAVIEFTPNRGKDSMFLASRPVIYSSERPLAYNTPHDMIRRGLTMAPEDSAREIVDNLVYTKSSEWSHEEEWRLVVHDVIEDGKEFVVLGYHPEEMTSVFLGCRMDENDRYCIYRLAKLVNPKATVFVASIAPRVFSLDFAEYSE